MFSVILVITLIVGGYGAKTVMSAAVEVMQDYNRKSKEEQNESSFVAVMALLVWLISFLYFPSALYYIGYIAFIGL